MWLDDSFAYDYVLMSVVRNSYAFTQYSTQYVVSLRDHELLPYYSRLHNGITKITMDTVSSKNGRTNNVLVWQLKMKIRMKQENIEINSIGVDCVITENRINKFETIANVVPRFCCHLFDKQ